MTTESDKKKGKGTKISGTQRAPQKANETAFKGKPGDIVVAVMGQTGVGKSTFVNHLVKKQLNQEVQIGHDLGSCTAILQPIPIPLEKLPSKLEDSPPSLSKNFSRLVIVDTPGFDDTYKDDSDILRSLAKWLASSYGPGMKLGGIIYLHDISQPRMLGNYGQIFKIMAYLAPSHSVIRLVMTKYAQLVKQEGEKRERQICNKYGVDADERQAHRRFDNTSDSAWDIVQDLLKSTPVMRTPELGDRQETVRKEMEEFDRQIGKLKKSFSLRSLWSKIFG